jgi:hypothetical protein
LQFLWRRRVIHVPDIDGAGIDFFFGFGRGAGGVEVVYFGLHFAELFGFFVQLGDALFKFFDGLITEDVNVIVSLSFVGLREISGQKRTFSSMSVSPTPPAVPSSSPAAFSSSAIARN